MLGNLRRYTVSTSQRFATRRGGEDLKHSLRIAKALPLYTSYAPQSYEAKPLPAPSPLRGEGWGERGGCSPNPFSNAARWPRAQRRGPQAMCRVVARASQLDQPLAPAVRGGREGPAGGMGRDAHSFSPGQDALSKSPAAPHELVGRSPTSAKRGCLFFWLLLTRS